MGSCARTVGKLKIKPLKRVWLQLYLTTESSPVVSYYFVSGQGTVAGDYYGTGTKGTMGR